MLVVGVVSGSACSRSSESRSLEPIPERIAVSDGWLAMGTFFDVDLRVRPIDREAARLWIEEARAEVARLEGLYSRHDSGSALSELNRRLAAGDEILTGLAPDLLAMLAETQRLRLATEGAFDVTIGPLVDLWAESVERGLPPQESELQQVRAQLGSVRIARDGRLRVERDGMRIDLDALSKGAVLDRLWRSFSNRFPEGAALLDFGQSSIAAIGDPDGGGWRLSLRSRDPERTQLGDIRVRDRALSMSSSLGQVRRIGQQIVSHVIDPRSGRPVDGSVDAVVIGSSATEADAWSTALLVMGATQRALELARDHGLECMVVEAGGKVLHTESWPQASL